MITMDIDSETPNSQPFRDIMATTDTITMATQKIEIVDRIMFLVASSRIRNAKTPAIMIP
jgi:hypothetical protein